jgi:hypothetical protein
MSIYPWGPEPPRRLVVHPSYPQPPRSDPFARKVIADALRVWRNAQRVALERAQRGRVHIRLGPVADRVSHNWPAGELPLCECPRCRQRRGHE